MSSLPSSFPLAITNQLMVEKSGQRSRSSDLALSASKHILEQFNLTIAQNVAPVASFLFSLTTAVLLLPRLIMTRLNPMIVCCVACISLVVDSNLGQCQVQSVDGVVDSDSKKENTRKLILKFFPDLDQDSVDGWVDAYSSMSETELTQLLQQRKVFGADFSGLQFNIPKLQAEDVGTVTPATQETSQTAPIARALQMVASNISGLHIAGHRCRTFCFTHTANVNDELGSVALQTSWNLAAGKIYQSGRSLDLALTSDHPTMFRLEPGCVLTCSGRFLRLPDGRLGQKVGDKDLALFPEVRIPESVTDFRIAKDGSVIGTGRTPEQNRLGQIKAVKIEDASQLQSANGVYFTVPLADQPTAFTPAKQIQIDSGKLELSNVSLASQKKLHGVLTAMQDSLR